MYEVTMNYCNKAQHFLLAFKGLACQKKSTPRSVSLRGVEFLELPIRISSQKRIFKKN